MTLPIESPGTTVAYHNIRSLVDLEAQPQGPDGERFFLQHPLGITEAITLFLNVNERGRHDAAVSCDREQILIRPSGARSQFWTNQSRQTLIRTSKNLLVKRSTHKRRGYSHRLWATHTKPDVVGEWLYQQTKHRDPELVQQLIDHIGQAPQIYDRVPLMDPSNRDVIRPLPEQVLTRMPAYILDPWIDATNSAQVARNLFGVKAYRKPLARQVVDKHPSVLSFYTLFRGLIPIEHIIGAMEAMNTDDDREVTSELDARTRRAARQLLRNVPATVLSRLVASTAPADFAYSLVDTVDSFIRRRSDPIVFGELIVSRGQRNIRTMADLEHIASATPPDAVTGSVNRRSIAAQRAQWREVSLAQSLMRINNSRELRGLPDLTWEQWRDGDLRLAELEINAQIEREAMAEQERLRIQEQERRQKERLAAQADRAAWAVDMTNTLHGLKIEDFEVVVATKPDQLVKWAATMGNCIGNYTNHIGLDILAAIIAPDGTVVLNLQINKKHGLIQMLGKFNKTLIEVVDYEQSCGLIRGLAAAGVVINRYTLGLKSFDIQAILQTKEENVSA